MSARKFTTAEIAAASGDDLEPEWVDIKGLNRMFSINRTDAFRLIRTKQIKSKLMRSRGTTGGRRLIYVDSVRSYIDGLPD